jgi:hypothetical protein
MIQAPGAYPKAPERWLTDLGSLLPQIGWKGVQRGILKGEVSLYC